MCRLQSMLQCQNLIICINMKVLWQHFKYPPVTNTSRQSFLVVLRPFVKLCQLARLAATRNCLHRKSLQNFIHAKFCHLITMNISVGRFFYFFLFLCICMLFAVSLGTIWERQKRFQYEKLHYLPPLKREQNTKTLKINFFN